MTQYKLPPAKAPVEAKVKAATIATYLGSLALLAILNGITSTNLVADLPDVIEVFVAPLVPAAITLVSGYVTRHTPRGEQIG